MVIQSMPAAGHSFACATLGVTTLAAVAVTKARRLIVAMMNLPDLSKLVTILAASPFVPEACAAWCCLARKSAASLTRLIPDQRGRPLVRERKIANRRDLRCVTWRGCLERFDGHRGVLPAAQKFGLGNSHHPLASSSVITGFVLMAPSFNGVDDLVGIFCPDNGFAAREPMQDRGTLVRGIAVDDEVEGSFCSASDSFQCAELRPPYGISRSHRSNRWLPDLAHTSPLPERSLDCASDKKEHTLLADA